MNILEEDFLIGYAVFLIGYAIGAILSMLILLFLLLLSVMR